MTRAVKTGELFSTFVFNDKDCADMGVYNVTSGSTYTMNLEPAFSDNKLEVPAYDGKYYYGTQITGQQFKFNCFCHDLTSMEYDNLRDWLHPRKLGKLILSDQPYKYYLVKVVSISDLSAYPLTSIQTPQYSILGDHAQGDVVYTGNFNVTFETVGSAYGYGLCYYRDDLIYDARKVYGVDYYYNSRLLYKDMCPKANWNVPADAVKHPIPMYNPGSAASSPKYAIEYNGKFAKDTFIQITNITNGASTVINIGEAEGKVDSPIIIDTISQVIEDGVGNVFYGRFSGSAMSISPYTLVQEIPETFVENEIDTDLYEYDSFHIVNNEVRMNPLILEVTEDLIGKYFSTNGNGGSIIKSVDPELNSFKLDDEVFTQDIPPAEYDEAGNMTRYSGVEYNYREIFNDWNYIPNPQMNDVVLKDDKFWIYTPISKADGEWRETNYFSGKEDFQNIYGDLVPVYRVFGATIATLDDIVISTGTGVGSSSVSAEAFNISAEMRPRYL